VRSPREVEAEKGRRSAAQEGEGWLGLVEGGVGRRGVAGLEVGGVGSRGVVGLLDGGVGRRGDEGWGCGEGFCGE